MQPYEKYITGRKSYCENVSFQTKVVSDRDQNIPVKTTCEELNISRTTYYKILKTVDIILVERTKSILNGGGIQNSNKNTTQVDIESETTAFLRNNPPQQRFIE